MQSLTSIRALSASSPLQVHLRPRKRARDSDNIIGISLDNEHRSHPRHPQPFVGDRHLKRDFPEASPLPSQNARPYIFDAQTSMRDEQHPNIFHYPYIPHYSTPATPSIHSIQALVNVPVTQTRTHEWSGSPPTHEQSFVNPFSPPCMEVPQFHDTLQTPNEVPVNGVRGGEAGKESPAAESFWNCWY